jgi:nitrogen regulatory protein PII
MPSVIVFVMPSVERCQDVLNTWEDCGVTGITIVETAGLNRLREIRARGDDLPLFPSLHHLLEGEEYHHRTAFTVVDDDFDLDRLVEATRQAVGGDFNAPNSGILFIAPVARAYGLRPHWQKGGG